MRKTLGKRIIVPRALLKELRGASKFKEIARRLLRLGYRSGDAAVMIECCHRLLGRVPTTSTAINQLTPHTHTKMWRQAHRERVQRYLATPEGRKRRLEVARASTQKWRATPEGLEASRKAMRIYSRKRLSTPEGQEANRKKARFWQKQNPEKCRAIAMLRKARKLAATPPWADLDAIRRFYEACPKKHHVDHVIPLCHPQLDGLHVLGNLQYLPASENCAKGNRLDLTPRQIARAIERGLALPKGLKLVRWRGHIWRRTT